MGAKIISIGPNKWYLDVYVRKNGFGFRKRETFYGTLDKADKRYFELRGELRERKPVSAKTATPRQLETFGQALELYRETKFQLSPKENRRFNFLNRTFGEIRIEEMTERLRAYLKHARQCPSQTTKRPLANGTINRIATLVKAVLNLAVRMEYLDKNPITNARFPKLKEVPRDKVLTEDEIARLFDVVNREAPHLSAILHFAMQVPCRISELRNMRKEDMDLINNAIRVRNGTTKNDQGCWKPIPPDLVGYFRSLPPECPYLFYKHRGGCFRPLGDFKKSWDTCKRLAGIQDFRFHDTRHISATNLLDNGTPEQVVMAVAGWKTNMLNTYYHRSGKKSLALVRFSPSSDTRRDTPRVEAG